MAIFELSKGKQLGNMPETCRDIVKGYIAANGFDKGAVFNAPWTTFYFIMTQDCNMNCPYCYQPKEFKRPLIITKKILDDSMAFILDNFDDSKIKFSIFGGEPFLNFPLIKYLVESYPQMKFVVTTNGLLIKENAEIRKFVEDNKNNLNLSISIGALRERWRENFIEEIQPCLDAVKRNGGDVHYVIKDPTDGDIYSEIVYLYDFGIPMVRLSAPRHWQGTQNKVLDYIDLFIKIADYIYFDRERPMMNRSPWDTAFRNNIFKYNKHKELSPTPPTFCGCGNLYLAINDKGDIYPCDLFANFPEFKLGSIYSGFNDNAAFFKRMGEWIDGLYKECSNCTVVPNGDIRLCPRAMCLAENYLVNGNPLKPAPLHCAANQIEFAVFDYISKKAIKKGFI